MWKLVYARAFATGLILALVARRGHTCWQRRRKTLGAAGILFGMLRERRAAVAAATASAAALAASAHSEATMKQIEWLVPVKKMAVVKKKKSKRLKKEKGPRFIRPWLRGISADASLEGTVWDTVRFLQCFVCLQFGATRERHSMKMLELV